MNAAGAPHTLVIFGASGDLARRKLLPALWRLHCRNRLAPETRIIGTGRTDCTDASFRARIAADLPRAAGDEALRAAFLERLFWQTHEPGASMEPLQAKIAGTGLCGNCIFYLAVPPALYVPLAAGLARRGMLREAGAGFRRLIVEKPFGYDLASARELDAALLACADEEQIYRIDHYLGKETVQNILATRFSNAFLESVWNRNHVDWVEITAAEDAGVGLRGGYYDGAGALRDMVQNHMMQVLALVAMEPPLALDAAALRNETAKVFRSLRPLDAEAVARDFVRGSYAGYRDEPGIAPDSRTETFVAARLFVDNWRWSGVPFLVRTGKRLPVRATEIVIHFRPAPHRLFPDSGTGTVGNMLVIRIQPDEGLVLTVGLKTPGSGFGLRQVPLHFHYHEVLDEALSEAYERLLLDCMNGDPALFLRGDAVMDCWRFLQPVLDAWRDRADGPETYAPGSWGPAAADRLVPEGQAWREPCRSLSADGLCRL